MAREGNEVIRFLLVMQASSSSGNFLRSTSQYVASSLDRSLTLYIVTSCIPLKLVNFCFALKSSVVFICS